MTSGLENPGDDEVGEAADHSGEGYVGVPGHQLQEGLVEEQERPLVLQLPGYAHELVPGLHSPRRVVGVADVDRPGPLGLLQETVGVDPEVLLGLQHERADVGADDPALLGVLGEGWVGYDDLRTPLVERVGNVPDDVGRPRTHRDAVEADVECLGYDLLELRAGVVGVVPDVPYGGHDDLVEVLRRSEGVEIVAVVLDVVELPGLPPVNGAGELRQLRSR